MRSARSGYPNGGNPSEMTDLLLGGPFFCVTKSEIRTELLCVFFRFCFFFWGGERKRQLNPWIISGRVHVSGEKWSHGDGLRFATDSGCGTPTKKWHHFMALKMGVILITYPSPGMILQVRPPSLTEF